MAQKNPRLRHHRQPSRLPRVGSSNNTSNRRQQRNVKAARDQETVAYVKQVLCSDPKLLKAPSDQNIFTTDDRPLDELLPPLTSSNAVDVELYAIIAVILSQFVQSWYNRITPDQEFVAEIVQIIAHCTRGIEDRLRHVDLEDLLLDELPALLISHIDAVNISRTMCSPDASTNEIRTIFHTLRPNKALSPVPIDDATTHEQQSNESAWSQLLVAHVLPLLLPPEDLSNPCLHVLVSEIFSEMVIRNALCGKASEPWLLWEGTTKLINALLPNITNTKQATSTAPSPSSRLEDFGLVSTADASTSARPAAAPPTRRRRRDAIAQVFWTTLQLAAMVWSFLRALVIALMHGSSIPARQNRSVRDMSPDKVRASAVASASRPGPQPTTGGGVETVEERVKRPIVSMRVWTLLSRLSGLQRRMPWPAGALSLVRWISLHRAGKICDTNNIMDRLLSTHLTTTLNNGIPLLPPLLSNLRSTLFPSNHLPPARIPPSAEEIELIKRQCAETIVSAIPPVVRERFFGTGDEGSMRAEVEGALEWGMGDGWVNRSLIVRIVEVIVVRVFPEVGVGEEE